MVKKNSICILASMLILLVLPWCTAAFIKSDGGMAACLLLFFVINPIASVAMGIFSGRHIRASWFCPFIFAGLFLLGTWLFFDMGEQAFIFYGAVYLVLGYAAMLITALIERYIGKRGK